MQTAARILCHLTAAPRRTAAPACRAGGAATTMSAGITAAMAGASRAMTAAITMATGGASRGGRSTAHRRRPWQWRKGSCHHRRRCRTRLGLAMGTRLSGSRLLRTLRTLGVTSHGSSSGQAFVRRMQASFTQCKRVCPCPLRHVPLFSRAPMPLQGPEAPGQALAQAQRRAWRPFWWARQRRRAQASLPRQAPVAQPNAAACWRGAGVARWLRPSG